MRVSYLYEGKEASYYSMIPSMMSGHSLGSLPLPNSFTLFQVTHTMKKNRIEVVLFSSPRFLKVLLQQYHKSSKFKEANEDSYQNYWGATWDLGGITFMCMPSLESLVKRPWGKFLFQRYIDKIVNKTVGILTPPMKWEVIDASYTRGVGSIILEEFEGSLLTSLDIETRPVRVTEQFAKSKLGYGLVAAIETKRKTDPIEYIMQEITCVGFCGLFRDSKGKLYSKSIVIPYKGEENYELIKALSANKTAKVMQNGKYDVIHLIVNNIPVNNWRFDTYGMMHSWYVELPRKLEFISSFTLRNHMYWKDESSSNLYEYNAKDTHATLWACVAMLEEFPDYAVENFSENFLQVFPCIVCSLEGFAVDWNEFDNKKIYYESRIEEAKAEAELVYGKGFNPNSPLQVKKILQYFGLPSAESSDKKAQQKFKDLNTFTERLISYVINYRKSSKMYSTYFNFPFLGDRWLYDLDPFGTETGRFASKSSSLWVGQQGQNFPMDARSPYIADPTYTLGGADNEQSESRCTAYISEDPTLIDSVENAEDFHKRNASLFFSIPEDKITKPIRTLSKRVNHGANYNMGESVLVETMGSKAVLESGRMLKLPANWGVKQIAKHLLHLFDTAYPLIKKKYYVEVVDEIHKTNKLVGATGWTRYCFGNPSTSKLTLNSYVAHAPQSLSVKIINRAFFKIWYEFQFKKPIIRMKMQKHDEIIWQSHPSEEWVGEEISKIMAEPTIVRGRSMVIPNEPEVGLHRWSDIGAG